MKVKEFYEQVDQEIIKYYKSSNKRDYYVSVFGKVYSVDKSNKNKVRKLKESVNTYGYLTVGIAGKNIRIHRIVATVFIKNPHPIEYTQVDHKNSLRFDNRASNLQWITPQANMDKSFHDVSNTRRKQKNIDKYCYDGSFMYEDYLLNKFRGNSDPYNEYLEKNEEFYG